ncbi:MAG: hypothetical protein QF473_10935 [Planctomycetota bacterium]|jgi:hypothetical protein|nr:hypothetical protein [Planctomycetota bacterium]
MRKVAALIEDDLESFATIMMFLASVDGHNLPDPERMRGPGCERALPPNYWRLIWLSATPGN